MSYQFSSVNTAGRTKYFPLEITRVFKSQTGVIESSEEFSRFIFLTNYNESFEANWSTAESNFGALNKTHRYSQTNRKIQFSFKLPARNVADSKENLEFCQNLARLVYGKYYTSYDSTDLSSLTQFGLAIYNYQGALFDIRVNFGNLIRNENVYISDFSFTPNFDAGIFEYSATPVTTENGESKLGQLKDTLFAQDSADLPETSYTSHNDLGKVYPKEVEVSLSFTVLHEYPLGFGGPRRPDQPYKWAENENRDWPHGTGPTYPVLEYMTKDNIEGTTALIEEEEPAEGEIPSETIKTGTWTLENGTRNVEFYINEYGDVVIVE
jgi:hypothetical protein